VGLGGHDVCWGVVDLYFSKSRKRLSWKGLGEERLTPKLPGFNEFPMIGIL
jgi:hypothetical protein